MLMIYSSGPPSSQFNRESADEDGMPSSGSNKHVKEKSEIASLKSELGYLLRQPLLARGISTKYITSGSRSVVDEIVAGTSEFSTPLTSRNDSRWRCFIDADHAHPSR